MFKICVKQSQSEELLDVCSSQQQPRHAVENGAAKLHKLNFL